MILALGLSLLAAKPDRAIMAHYMPWYSAKPMRKEWGWHWTMGKFDPDKGELASQFHPSIGPYDSQDPDVIEYHLLTMKMAGIDGVLVDWYGIDNLYDYPEIHKSSQMVFEATKKFGMKFGVVYEDATLKNLIEKKVVRAEDAIEVGKRTMQWLNKNWFSSPNYLRIQDKPALLVFGPQYYKPEDWSSLLAGINVSFFTLHHKRGMAVGAYDWPLPGGGNAGCEKERLAFLERSKEWPAYVSAAYPRFQDIYKQAGLHDSYGTVLDENGATFRHTLDKALSGSAPVVQIATWNDWGEGTQIEPSVEFGHRDLALIQKLRRKYLDVNFSRKEFDLQLPRTLYYLRKTDKTAKKKSELDRASALIAEGKTEKAAQILLQD